MENISYNYFWQRVADKLNEGMMKRNREAQAVLESQSEYLVRNRIDNLRSRLLKIIGFDFQKCDLNPEITGIMDMGDYIIEKILIQSLTDYYVPMHIYKPKTDKKMKYPAVLVTIGHYIEGKNLPENQIFCANLALQGYVVLTFDPIFQGERDAFPENLERHSEKDKWVVVQHIKGAIQGYLLGIQLIKYYLWDGIRALDYLCTREDVDENNIGCCGQSGGGTQTAYLSAIDPRIKVSIPIHYITNVEDDLRVNGVGDAEQATYGLIRERIDKCDLLWMFAPKPVLINAALKDIFPLEGTVRAAHELKKLYWIFDREDLAELAEIDTDHYISKGTREVSYLWFNRWLRKESGMKPEKQIKILSSEELSCGYSMKNSLNVLDINKQVLDKSIKQRRKAFSNDELSINLKNFFTKVYRDGYRVNVIDIRSMENGLTIEKFNLYTNSNYEIFGELFIKEGNKKLMVVLDMGKILPEETVSKYTELGYNILNLKPFGYYYTTGRKDFYYDEQSVVAHCIFAGENDLISIRVNEILCCFDYIIKLKQPDCLITMLGTGQGGILSLIAGLYESCIGNVMMINSLASYESLFENKDYFVNESDIICGFLNNFDIPDLVLANSHRRIIMINPVDRKGECCSPDYANSMYKEAIKDSSSNFSIIFNDKYAEEPEKYFHKFM